MCVMGFYFFEIEMMVEYWRLTQLASIMSQYANTFICYIYALGSLPTYPGKLFLFLFQSL